MLDEKKTQIVKAAQKDLDARAEFPNSSLADLYDPLTMQSISLKAHSELDKARGSYVKPSVNYKGQTLSLFCF